jgi:hypothetical protein
MRAVILLPWRSDNGWREKLWQYCRTIWEREFPDWSIHIGPSDDGPFQRSQAVNRAAAEAGDWDVALIIDGDTVSHPQAVRAAVSHALDSGGLAIAHRSRLMLTKSATQQLLAGKRVDSGRRQNVSRVWSGSDSVSCAVAVSRGTWDLVGGFDERFVGWGGEDTAFLLACETLTGMPAHFEQAECLHLWHEAQPEASRSAPTYVRNQALRREYEWAHLNEAAMLDVIAGRRPALPNTVIPRILHRTVPADTPRQVEEWWEAFGVMHPDWELRTYREPIDPADWPLTGDLFARCDSGAQKAGLIRLEALYAHGGVYVDSDVEPVRPLDPLLHLRAFAAWEDENVVPDAVLGAEAGHPAFKVMLAKARAAVESGGDPWASGPGVTTGTLPGRNDVLLLPPGSFYPVHYKEKHRLGTRNDQPWVFLEHKWHHSWATKRSTIAAAAVAPAVEKLEVDVPNDVAICIPWRDSGDERRRRAYKWCVEWWASCGLRPVIGLGQSRAEMCNHAARQALDNGYRVLVFADADTWCPPSQVVRAAALAREGRLALAYEVYSRLDGSATAHGLRQRPAQVSPERYARMGKQTRDHVSGLVAVSADLWSRVGGFDERFTKWGFEDQAFYLACEVLGDGAPVRVPGLALHWAHRADPTRGMDPSIETICLMGEYCNAAGRIPEYGRTGKLGRSGAIVVGTGGPDPAGMREVLAEEGGPLSARSAVQ